LLFVGTYIYGYSAGDITAGGNTSINRSDGLLGVLSLVAEPRKKLPSATGHRRNHKDGDTQYRSVFAVRQEKPSPGTLDALNHRHFPLKLGCRFGSPNQPHLTLLPNAKTMGFNKRKMEDERRRAAEKEAAARRATDGQILEDAERLIAAWNERQAKRMPMLFSPTIGAAITAKHWFLWVRCPACRTETAIDLRLIDRHHNTALTGLIPALSCRSCRPNSPFAEIVRLAQLNVTEELYHQVRLDGA
jgi:hypothetical protein